MGLFLSVYVDDIKLAGKKQNIDPTWKILMKDVELGELHSKRMSTKQKYLWTMTGACVNPETQLELKKATLYREI